MAIPHSIDVSYTHANARVRIVFANGKGNILTTALLADLRSTLQREQANKHLKLITIEGFGANFSYGASIQEHTPDAIAQEMHTLRGLVMDIASSPVSVAAIVRGYCLGGGFEVILPCHFIFAASDAMFGTPEMKLGVFPPVAAVLLPRLVSQQFADRLVIAGEQMDAQRMEHAGIVHTVAEDGQLEGEFSAWFEATLEKLSASSLRFATRAARARLTIGLDAEIAELERIYVEQLLKTHDANEGIRAFLEKRKPQWRDE